MKQHRLDFLMVLPAIIVVAVMTQVPFILTLIYSTLRWNLARPDLPIRFIGFDNYLYFLRNPQFYTIIGQTLILTVVPLLLCAILGFLLAILFDNRVPGINVARALMLAPFFVMATASGVVWKTTILNTTFGWYGVIARALGFEPVDLISYYPLQTLVGLYVWQWMPFFFLVILAGLQNIPGDVIDSMRVDGAGWFQATFGIKLPMISAHMAVALMLGLIFIIKDIGLILVTTAGGPGTRSYTLPYYVYMQVFNASQVGRAGALAAMTAIITLVVINLLNWILRKRTALYG